MAHQTKVLSALIAVAAGLCPSAAWAQASVAPATIAKDCAPRGAVTFVCGPGPAEDMIQIPGTAWILADSRRDASVALRVFDTETRTATTIYPAATGGDRHDRITYGACPGPLAKGDYITHGVTIAPAGRGRYTIFAVHHGARESIEVFDLRVGRGAPPSATWIGCVVAPDATFNLNSVVALRGGGFIATNFIRPGPEALERARRGEISGELWEWRRSRGWTKIPGSEASAPNGVELSADGRWLYVAAWGDQTFIRLSRGAARVQRDVISLGFRADNVKWGPDGWLYVAGQTEGAATGSKAIRVDPKSLNTETLIELPDTPAFSFGTVAIPVGDAIWLGSSRWGSLAVFPAPR